MRGRASTDFCVLRDPGTNPCRCWMTVHFLEIELTGFAKNTHGGRNEEKERKKLTFRFLGFKVVIFT